MEVTCPVRHGKRGRWEAGQGREVSKTCTPFSLATFRDFRCANLRRTRGGMWHLSAGTCANRVSPRSMLALALLCCLAATAARAEHASPATMIHGNLYIHGLATSVEFFRADFGGLPSCAKLDVVVPAETHGCKLASGADGRALLVQRGKCSFYDKMVQAQASNASLLIVANSEPGLLRMPAGKASGDMVDLHIPGIMVRNASAEVFFQLAKEGRLGHVQTHTPGEGCVPISQPAGSEPQATAEQPSPTSAVEVQLPGGVAFEGALATFGPPLPTDLRNAELVMFPDVLACTEAAPAELNELQGRCVPCGCSWGCRVDTSAPFSCAGWCSCCAESVPWSTRPESWSALEDWQLSSQTMAAMGLLQQLTCPGK